ncbi:MAG: fused MFS/spermidine synthase [Myxococcota bacterium]
MITRRSADAGPSPSAPAAAREVAIGLPVAAVFSGAAALLFETLWFRAAGIAFGRGIWASSLVLAAFMAGLAVGNLVAARRADRVGRPILLYAVLEVVIGVAASITVLGLPAIDSFVASWIGSVRDTPGAANAVRLGLAFAAMVLPASAMGATLPVLVRGFQGVEGRFGATLGRLYGWNTLGAVAGALLGEAWLIGRVGLPGAALAAAGLNGLAALVALGLSRRAEGAGEGGLAPAATAPGRGWGVDALGLRRLVAAWLAGGLFLALEAVWFRLLSLFVFGTSWVFASLLATVLAGIGLGGLAAGAWLSRVDSPRPWLPALALGCGFTTLASYAAYGPIQALLLAPGQMAHAGWHAALIAAPLVGPTALLSGVLFTALGDDARSALSADGRTTGWLTFANTLGAALGALAGGFWLLPTLGVERSILGLGLAYLALLPLVSWPRAGAGSRVAVATAAALVVAAVLFPSGALRSRHLAHPLAIYGEPGSEVAAIREGRLETLVLLRTLRFGEPLHDRLLSNGYSQSATHYSARRYMKAFVHLPVALRPDPRSALLLSYGIGSTARALVDTESLERIAIVDISPDVLEFTDQHLGAGGTSPLRDPRVEVFVEDARFHLQTRTQTYDLITGEPPPPKLNGVVNLFTREYFAAIRERLDEGGIASYWLPVHDLTGRDLLAVVRGFCDVFPDCTLWAAAGLDWMMMGQRGGHDPLSEARLRAQWSAPGVASELEAIGFESAEALLATWIAGPERLARETRDVLPLVDAYPRRLSDTPVLADHARNDPLIQKLQDPARAREDFRRSGWVASHLPEALVAEVLPWFEWEGLVRRQLVPGSGAALGERHLHRVILESPLHTLLLWMLGSSHAEQRIVARRPEAHRDPALWLAAGIGALADRDYPRAAADFARAHGGRLPAPRARALEALSLCLDGERERARAAARELLRRAPGSRRNDGYWSAMSRTCGWPDPR